MNDLTRKHAAQIARLQKKFRILEEWTFILDPDETYAGTCSLGFRDKETIIYPYPWKDSDQEYPDEYLLHEMLHTCIFIIKETQEPNYLVSREKEELFVQDLSALLDKHWLRGGH